jgi:HK97 gp10 family phage protein
MSARTTVDYDEHWDYVTGQMAFAAEVAELKTARKIAAEAKRRAPRLNAPIVMPSFVRLPGWLADSIEVMPTVGDGASVQVGVFYGGFVEYGTEHSRAQPYFRPALLNAEDELLDATRDEIQESLR